MYHNYDALPIVLTVPQLAAALNIGKNTAYDLCRSGAIRCVRVGRQLRIPKDAVIEYLAAA